MPYFLLFCFFFSIPPPPELLPVLGPLERYMMPTLDATLLCSSRLGFDLGCKSDWLRSSSEAFTIIFLCKLHSLSTCIATYYTSPKRDLNVHWERSGSCV